MAAGPGFVGTAVAHAGLFGIGPDIFDLFGDDKKSDLHHPRPEADVGAQSSRTTAGVTTAEAPTAKVGSLPENANARGVAASEAVDIPGSVGRGGGGGLPLTNAAVRAGNLPRVSSAPVTRSIVIRGVPQSASPAASAPEIVSPALPQAPAIVALAAPPPEAPEPASRPAVAAPPAPAQSAPQGKDPLAPNDSGATRMPDGYRIGYAEYLRSATTSDLFAAALPGVAGIAGFTLVGAYAGYRQAKSLRRALLAPVPTSILL
ncbi:hypothetical protein [Mycolicibacterium stellerae]|uniref:hypothetical protein n=1 Tax=Mycolicibacterium stellerae TaxID=2358193 RepID=UPI0013DDCF92|nr:hypothetical protein [Mycolicibacterium stellerae]